MTDKEKIAGLIREKLDDGMFLVDVSVNSANVIHVEVDSFTGLTIDQCVALSRHIEGNLDRETEDFELQVSSPGADQPFKVKEQYRKNQGREVEVTLTSGVVLKGMLVDSGEEEMILETSAKVKVEGKNKKELVTERKAIPYSEIKKTRVIISFK
ncbi:ribosome maturation factor RimP [Bacteroidales bacterium 6E]|nr:ribosome maturation factor RimP [Bacteroidales bacterium 6E]